MRFRSTKSEKPSRNPQLCSIVNSEIGIWFEASSEICDRNLGGEEFIDLDLTEVEKIW